MIPTQGPIITHNVFVSCTVQWPLDIYKHVLQLTCMSATWLLHFRYNPLPIQIESTYQWWIGSIAIWSTYIRLRENPHKYRQDWTRSDRNSIAIDVLVRTGLKRLILTPENPLAYELASACVLIQICIVKPRSHFDNKYLFYERLINGMEKNLIVTVYVRVLHTCTVLALKICHHSCS